MEESTKKEFDLTKRRRRYFSEDCGLHFCPECKASLIKVNCTVVIEAKSEMDEGTFLSNMTGSHFCESCPVIVFDSDRIAQAVRLGLRGGENIGFILKGVVDFESVPPEKRHMEMGTDENPVPLVPFLAHLNSPKPLHQKKAGRNDPCPCGSGKKYKKCCA